MNKKVNETSLPIDAGQGIPLFIGANALLLCILLVVGYITYGSRNRLFQSIFGGFVLYCIGMILYRIQELKLYTQVPAFKGWDQHTKDVNEVHKKFLEFLERRDPGEKASINRFKRGAHESHRVVETKYKETSHKINLGTLDGIIEIDKETLLLHSEPGVPMDEMATIAIAHGYIPQIVPEFPGITVGGAIGGVAGESTGHKYGLFHNTIESMDVITGDGVLHRNISRTNKSDLFMAMCGSYGTQGILVRAAIRLMPAPKFVKTDYYHCESIQDALDTMEVLASETGGPEFLDGVALSPSSVIVVAGYPAEESRGSILSLRGSRSDPWFFWYLTDLARKNASSKGSIHTDYISLDDYLFRFDKGAFWAARHGMMFLHSTSAYNPESTSSGPHPLLRALWSWVGTTRQMYKMCHAPGDKLLAESYIVQDFILPTKSAAIELTKFNTEETYNIWPLWICPIRKVEGNHEQDTGFGLPLEGKQGDLMFNLGFYGPVNGGRPMNPVQKNKELEQKVFKEKGKKWLYAQSFYTEDEFWAHFHKENYETLRTTYKNNEVFHDITTKVLLSKKTKESICTECSVNIWSYIHKVALVMGLGYVELLTPRFLQPFLGITHTQTKVYV